MVQPNALNMGATTRLDHYIVGMLPWAHGHQRKAIRDFEQVIIDQQTG